VNGEQRAREIMVQAGVPFDAAVLALEFAEAAPDGDGSAEAARAQAVATFERLRARP
jgi:hypothetical protein